MQEHFGTVLRSVRADLRMSQESIAQAIGTTQRHISFLETGRSEPSLAMLGRLVAGLDLKASHRAALFSASGFRNPYPERKLSGAELQNMLDLMTRQVLRHWPFPCFVVDQDWNFLRTNAPAQTMLDSFGDVANMHALFLAPQFSEMIVNWEQASASFYTRIQQVARRSEIVRSALDAAIADGRFDHVSRVLGGKEEVPVYVPIEVQFPNGPRMRFTSMHGRWASIHDAMAEQFEVEFLVPLDEDSESVATAVFGGEV